ncbi:MAG: PDDEXK nuclease domain-containing protein, partial [bacterium]
MFKNDKSVSLTQAPEGYSDWLTELKLKIHNAQQRATLAVNRELILLYWQIGRDILARQAKQGWGTKVIERLAHDLRNSFPNMKGFSRTNLLYMRSFAESWTDEQIVQQLVGQLPWGHNLVLLDKLSTQEALRSYVVIELKADKFKPEHLGQLGFYMTAVDKQIKLEHDAATIGLLLCKSKDKVVAEYALGDKSQPMGIAE